MWRFVLGLCRTDRSGQPLYLQLLDNVHAALKRGGPASMTAEPALPQRRRQDLKIFVQIASYRDVDCQWTVRDLFEQAEFPDRIFAGICWQFVPDEDQDCFQIETRPDQVRRVDYHAKDARGVGFARGEAQKLLQDEDFVLQIDAHHRFVEHWDSKMIDWLYRCPSARPILTTFPRGFVPPREIQSASPLAIACKDFKHATFPVMTSRALQPVELTGRPLPTAFIASNFIFAPASAVQEVPYDPHLYFDGDDILTAARYWTAGWDMFSPTEHLTWHDWNRKGRRSHWEDAKNWYPIKLASDQRIRHILGIESTTEPAALLEVNRFRLGQHRSIASYQAYAGIDFQQRSVDVRAKQGIVGDPIVEVERIPGPAAAKIAIKPDSLVNLKQIPQSRRRGGKPHEPRLIHASAQMEVYDDFLPEKILDELHRATIYADHRHINTGDKISRSWRPHDGFPLRSELSLFWYHEPPKDDKKPHWQYPSSTGFDLFAEHVAAFLPKVEHLIGKRGQDWLAFSISSFIYPARTGLSLHKDGRHIYSGAYTYFLSPDWDIHWGGILIVLDPATQLAHEEIQIYGQKQPRFTNVWLDRARENPHVYAPGLGQVVLPKRNRVVFIDPDCYHMITHVNEHAGDHARMALSGFFHAKPPAR